MYNFETVKIEARKRALEVLTDLYGVVTPLNGTVFLGSPLGEAGRSCAINVEGEGAGTWTDFAPSAHPLLNETMTHGDIIDLVRFVKGIGYYEACVYIGNLLGLPSDYIRLDLESLRFHESLTGGRSYFTSSGISDKTIDYCSDILTLAETNDSQYIAFLHPHHSDPGTILAAHLLFPKTSADDKNSWAWFNKPTHLWGLYKAVENRHKMLVITEGEKDAMAVMEAGFSAVSIPSGVNNTKWIEADIDFLRLFPEVCIMFDNDQAGLTASRKVMFELANLGVIPSVVSWGGAQGLKDAADVLKYCGSSRLQELINKKIQISLDFSTLVLEGKPNYAIVTIDGKQFTVAQIKSLLNQE